MTNKHTVAASEVRVNDHIYSGTGTNAHPTFAWETVTEVRTEDGLILLVTGNIKGQHGEFWLEPDEQIAVTPRRNPHCCGWQHHRQRHRTADLAAGLGLNA